MRGDTEKIKKTFPLNLYRQMRFYATTEQKLIHSFCNALRIRRKINQLHQSLCYTSSIYYTKPEMGVDYLGINKLPYLHEINIPKCIDV
jgi:hypothetical protein